MTQNVKLPAKAQALADYATSKGLLVTVDSQEETLASTGRLDTLLALAENYSLGAKIGA